MNFRLKKAFIQVKIFKRWRAGRTPTQRFENKKDMLQAIEKIANDEVFFSISHTRHLGGFAVSTQPVGFDLEPTNRELSEKAYQRLADREERRLKVEPIYLWVMKEAAWKALQSFKQPKTITQIKITKIIRKDPKHLRFSFKSNKTKHLNHIGYGLLIVNRRTIMGIAIANH